MTSADDQDDQDDEHVRPRWARGWMDGLPAIFWAAGGATCRLDEGAHQDPSPLQTDCDFLRDLASTVCVDDSRE
jgi:hypothetical protein